MHLSLLNQLKSDTGIVHVHQQARLNQKPKSNELTLRFLHQVNGKNMVQVYKKMITKERMTNLDSFIKHIA